MPAVRARAFLCGSALKHFPSGLAPLGEPRRRSRDLAHEMADALDIVLPLCFRAGAGLPRHQFLHHAIEVLCCVFHWGRMRPSPATLKASPGGLMVPPDLIFGISDGGVE